MNKLISTASGLVVIFAFLQLVLLTDQDAMFKQLGVMIGAGILCVYFYLVHIVEDILLAEPKDEENDEYRDSYNDNYEDPA